MKTGLFNPFKYVAGNKALLLGMGAMLATALLCFFTHIHLDGVIDIHRGRQSASSIFFAEPFIDWLCLLLPFYIFGRNLSASSIRFIDVAGTLALARYPMFFATLVSMFIPSDMGGAPAQVITTLLNNPALMARLVIAGLLALPFIIWSVALMYNAYSVSANLKGGKAVWSFIASLVIAEIISKIIFLLII